jgi:hypothetical protein
MSPDTEHESALGRRDLLRLGTGAAGLSALGLLGLSSKAQAQERDVVNLRIQRLEQVVMPDGSICVTVCFVYNVPNPPPPPPIPPFTRVILLNTAMPGFEPLAEDIYRGPQDPNVEVRVAGGEVFVWFTFYAWRCDFVIIIVDNRCVCFHVGG